MAKANPRSATKSKVSAKAKASRTVIKSVRNKPKIVHRPLPNVLQLTRTAAVTLNQNKRLFLGIAIIYGLLSLILVQGLAKTADINNLKLQLGQTIQGRLGALTSSLTLLVTLFGSSANSTSAGSGAYQLLLGIVASLATIWALRQVLAGSKINIRDAFYRGMYPLVPFILVLLVIGLELLPLLIGITIFSLVINNGIAVLLVEKLLWLVVLLVLSLTSMYLLTSSIVALYIVTLADMTPLKALRSARKLFKRRRWIVMRKLLFLPLLLMIITAIVMFPVLFWITPLTPWVFYVLTILSLTAVHAYVYTLYRELINE